jgi:hypothetical protein
MRGPRSSWGLLLLASAWAQTPESASVQGSVTNSMTGAPVLRARIALRGSGRDAKNYTALTTADGKFTIPGVVPGHTRRRLDGPGSICRPRPSKWCCARETRRTT